MPLRLPAPRSELTTRRLAQAGACLAALLLLTLLLPVADNPPGFYRDESGIALNAALLAQSGRDEHGALLPLYFRSYGDWKSAPYIYLLSGVYAVTGPSEEAARLLSSFLGWLAVLVLGLLGHRLSGSRSVGAATAVLAAATPWLFEVSRLVFEVALLPVLLALLLLLLARLRCEQTWRVRDCAAVGLALALVAYSYAGGRALAPMLALALVVFARGRRRRSVLVTWACFAAALVPMALFVAGNPRALLVRFAQVNDADSRDPLGLAVAGARNLVQELDLVRWVVEGDGNLRHHVGGGGSLLASGVLLALAGVVVLVRSGRWDAFWSYTAVSCLAAAVPAAISDIRIHALRSVALPVFLLALAVPAMGALRARIRQPAAGVAASLLTAGLVAQTTFFHVTYAERGPQRREAFHADVPRVLRAALAGAPGPVAVYDDDPDAWGNATWYAELWDEPVEVLRADESPAPGQAVLAVERRCAPCTTVAEGGSFIAYLAR